MSAMSEDATTAVAFGAVKESADAKDEQAKLLQAAAAVVGGAAAVAIALNRGSMAAIGAAAACGVVAAYLVGNSKAVESNAEQLRASGDSFAAATENHAAAVGGLVDGPGAGINARTWA